MTWSFVKEGRRIADKRLRKDKKNVQTQEKTKERKKQMRKRGKKNLIWQGYSGKVSSGSEVELSLKENKVLFSQLAIAHLHDLL